MATLGLDDDELKSVEQMISKLAQLSSSIQSLKNDIIRSNPLPHPCASPLTVMPIDYVQLMLARSSSLQASAQIIQRNLQNVLANLQENSELFDRMALHPSTNFPGRTQEGILGQLLRKKLEPNVEELVEQGRETARLVTPEGLAMLQEVWDECRDWTMERIAKYVEEEAGDVYTKQEREMGVENVHTGLKRELEEFDSDDEDEDEEGEGKEAQPRAQPKEQPFARGLEPETLLWFAARGDFAVPANIEYERKDPYKGLQGVNLPPDDTEQP